MNSNSLSGVNVTGSHYLSKLSGKDAYDFLVGLLITENEQTFEIAPPPNKGYNLRSYVVDEDSFDT